MITLLLLCAAFGAPLHIQDTEMYQVMRTEEVFVQPNGEVYVLNYDESRIQYYGADGQLIKNIGRRGNGPGEFTYPTYFTVMGEHLYILDGLNDTLITYKLNGDYVNSMKPPQHGLKLNRAASGWFYWTEGTIMDDTKSAPLMWSDDSFGESRQVVTIKELGWGMGSWGWSDGTHDKNTYSPLEVRPRMLVSPTGEIVYFSDPLVFKIDLYDGRTGKKIRSIQREDKLIPFDTDWADELFKLNTKGTRQQNPGIKIDKLYPKNFPAIRGLMLDPDGNLVVDRWRGRPDDHHYPIAFDASGAEIPMKYPYKVLHRLAGVANGHAYLIMLEDDEAGLAKVPLAEAAAFVDQYPITDWSRSRSISISR